jgi:hypothetical protein
MQKCILCILNGTVVADVQICMAVFCKIFMSCLRYEFNFKKEII